MKVMSRESENGEEGDLGRKEACNYAYVMKLSNVSSSDGGRHSSRSRSRFREQFPRGRKRSHLSIDGKL